MSASVVYSGTTTGQPDPWSEQQRLRTVGEVCQVSAVSRPGRPSQLAVRARVAVASVLGLYGLSDEAANAGRVQWGTCDARPRREHQERVSTTSRSELPSPEGSGSPIPTVLRTPERESNRPSRPRQAMSRFARLCGLGSGPDGSANSGSLWLTGKGPGNRPAKLPALGPRSLERLSRGGSCRRVASSPRSAAF